MSEFLAEAQVLVVPNTAAFAATLRTQLTAAVAAAGPVVVPVTAAPLAAANTGAFVVAQKEAEAATLGLASAVQVETSAFGRQAEILSAATIAARDDAAATELQGAAKAKATAATNTLTAAQRTGTAATAQLAAISKASATATTEVAIARAELIAANRAVATGEKALAAALVARNVAVIDAASNTLALARAEQLNADTAFRNAVAHHAEAAAAAESAAAHAQATRGIAAETLALTGLRGATLAASAPFLIGATAAIVFSKSIKAASDETEELNKTAVVFGQNSDQIIEFAEGTAAALGISTEEALKSAAVFGNLFRTIKISEPVAADMSQRLVELSADLASFNNASPERTLEALRAGLVGQARPLRVFGIFLSAARVQQEALVETGKKSVKQLTEAEKVQARFNLILRDSSLAQGDFARTSDRLANQSRILKAQLSDVSAALGRQLLPAMLNIVTASNNVITIFGDLSKIAGDAADSSGQTGGQFAGLRVELARLLAPGAAFKNLTGELAKGLDFLAGKTKTATKETSGFHFALGGLTAAIATMQAAAASVDFGNITTQLRGLEVERLKIQTGLAPGGRASEEANLKQQIENDKKAVAQAKSGTKARKDAIIALKQDQDELAALQSQDASDAEDRAQRVKDAAARQAQAARDAAQAQADATQAFIESFSGRRGRLETRLTSAQLFGTAKTQIALNKLIIAADKAEIDAIKDRIRHLHLHGDALKLAQRTIAALNEEIFSTRNAIIQLQAERKQVLADARQSHLEAQLAIAETTASTRDDVAAEKALIKFDQVQIRRILAIKRRRRLTQEEAAQLDAYRVDLAQRNAALKKTKEEVVDTGKKLKELTFAFLQTQQGFAANLLGNLIPGFATGGLVGGSTPASPQRPVDLGRPEQAVQQSAALGASRDRGVRPIQVDTTNQILRHILRVLQNQTGRMGHPEARYQKAVGSSSFDTQ